MKRKTYYIQRTVGLFQDTLLHLWEGNDLPTFSRREPYYFDSLATAQRVCNRLGARYKMADGIPGVCRPAAISFEVITVEWDDDTCPCCGDTEHCSTQHLGQFV